MSFSARRAVRWVVVLLVLGGGAAAGVYYYRRAALKPKAQFETVSVDRGRIVARLMASGTLSPLVTVQVGSQVSGRLKDIYVDFNAVVRKGQIVARIDPQLFQAALEQARANHLAGQASLVKARVQAAEADRQLVRTRALAEKQLVAPAERDTAQSTADAAKAGVAAAAAQLAQAKASLNQAQVNLAYTIIRSPIDGVVISRNVDVGQTVAASLQAPTLFTIAEDLAKMQIHTNVAEADIGRVRPRMTISFSVDAYPREHFSGEVSQIRNSPQTVQNVVTYDVVVDVENPSLRLRPGMTANVNFVYAETGEVLRVSNAALRFRPPRELLPAEGSGSGWGAARAAGRPAGAPGHGGKGGGGSSGHQPGKPAAERRTVWVLEDGVPRPVSIRVGLSDGTRTEVSEGALREGDQVITEMSGSLGPAAGPRPPGLPGRGGRGRGIVRHL